MKSNSKALKAVLLTSWHRLCYFKCLQPRTSYCRQPQTQNLATYHLLGHSLWYFVPVRIHEICCESSISWTIRVYKLICLLDIILKKDQET